uniref:VWFA domain-containing protein n=1 Tax=Romanomermis culicivorax TaxID=13658 RepID=A0A915J234_ROMCU
MTIVVVTLWAILSMTFDTSVFAAMENGLALPEIVYKRTSAVSGGQRHQIVSLKARCHTQGKPLDLILIIDSSGSLRTQSDEEFQVIRDIISIVAVSPDATRIALVQYSGVARSEFHFNTFTTRQQILDAVQVINPLFGITKTGNALAQAISELDAEKGMRPGDVPKIAFLISDGRTQDYPDDTNQAVRLRSYGVDVWSYGLGEYVAIEELINVTGDANKVVTRKNYPHLKELFEPFKGVEICEKATVCIPGTERPLDLLFLIDSSESVEKKFQDEIDFIRRTLNNVNVHPDAVRVATLLYSGKPVVAFDFRRYQNLEGSLEWPAISDVPFGFTLKCLFSNESPETGTT